MTTDSTPAIDATLHSSGGHGVVRVTSRYATDAEDVWSALTDPARLARWFGRVEGDLRVGGEFAVLVSASGFDGHGLVKVCDRPHTLRVTMWEEVGKEHDVVAELTPDGDFTRLVIEAHGVPLDVVWAYGAGWHLHVEDLSIHLTGRECEIFEPGTDPRWDPLEAIYRERAVSPYAH